MTTTERIYAALLANPALVALYGGALAVYLDAAPQNPASPTGWPAGELAYSVYRDFPASQISYTLSVPSKNAGLTVRRLNFESWSTGSTVLALTPATHARRIASAIEATLAAIAEPGGVSAVYPAGIMSVQDDENKSICITQEFIVHTALP